MPRQLSNPGLDLAASILPELLRDELQLAGLSSVSSLLQLPCPGVPCKQHAHQLFWNFTGICAVCQSGLEVIIWTDHYS